MRLSTADSIDFRTTQAERGLRAIPTRFADDIQLHSDVERWAGIAATSLDGCTSLVLAGPTGTGKTHSAYTAIRRIVLSHGYRGRAIRWAAITFPDLTASQRGNQPDAGYVLHRITTADLALIDDIGTGKNTDWTGDVLHRVIDHRWSHQLPTIYTTNIEPKHLAATLGERIASRMSDAVRVAIKGTDRRWIRDGAA